MLTWAVTFLILKDKAAPALGLVIAMGCDVAIFYYIACAISGARL